MEEILEDSLARRGGMVDGDQDTLWIQASRQGDTLAFNRLVLKWERTVYNLVLRMLGDREEASEVTQEVFLSAFRSIRGFKGDSRFSTWIYRIAVNRSITRLRRRPPLAHSLDDLPAGPSLPPQLQMRAGQELELLNRERQQSVRKALMALPPEQRLVIELKFYREQTFEEIASLLETPLSTVKSRFYSALDVLRGRLACALEN